MSDDAPFQPPQKKPSVFWLLGGFFVLLVALFLYQLFGPNPPIIVSPQTTHITGPPCPDGLPNYKQYLLELHREGVTPENNAAALLWPALWPGELDPFQYAAIAAELGLTEIPSEQDAVDNFYKGATKASIIAWLQQQSAPDETRGAAQNPLDDAAEKVIDRSMSCIWTSEQVPPLALWVAENQKPLDQMVEASKRTRCYFPSPSLLENVDQRGVVALLLPGPQSSRSVARYLGVRAMWHAGENRPLAAWNDLRAVHRIGRLTAQGGTIVEQLVGMAIDGIAREGTLALLDRSELSVEQARQVQRDLASLDKFDGMAKSFDTLERFMYLDTVIDVAIHNNLDAFVDIPNGQQIPYFNNLRVNWNVALNKGNELYDKLVAGARAPTRAERQQAMLQFENEIRQLDDDLQQPGNHLIGLVNPARRSEIAASTMICVLLPAITGALTAEDRFNAMLDLERLAAALAVYRAEHGNYPEKLSQLIPAIVDTLPVDVHAAKPFIYKRTPDGYLLYSTGDNGRDDGGSNEQMSILEGREVEEFETSSSPQPSKIPTGADDISVRMQRPTFKLPKIAPPASDNP